eukprot:jgi/Botrbrau1/19440/Bobra.0338s0062.1
MLEMDQILRANELSLALVAAVPALILLAGAVTALLRWLKPRPPDPHREAAPCRLAMVEVERAFDAMGDEGSLSDKGMVLYHIVRVYCLASRLFRRQDGNATSEWPALRVDLLDLAGPLPISVKRRICQRMVRSFSVLKP